MKKSFLNFKDYSMIYNDYSDTASTKGHDLHSLCNYDGHYFKRNATFCGFSIYFSIMLQQAFHTYRTT